MNAAVRATVRVGLYTGAKVYFVHEVKAAHTSLTCHDISNKYSICRNSQRCNVYLLLLTVAAVS